jgi:hypothetical protein
MTDHPSCIVPHFLSPTAWDDLTRLSVRVLSTNASGLEWPWMSPDHLVDLPRLRQKYEAGIDDEEEHFALRFADQAELAAFVRRHDVRSVYALIERRPGRTFLACVPLSWLEPTASRSVR